MAATSPTSSANRADETTPERQLAYDLLSQESGLWGEILFELLGQPKRYSNLKPLLGDQAENTLTYALRKLVDEGLVERTSDVIDDELVERYAISRKGIDVFLHMQLLQTIGRFATRSQAPATRGSSPGQDITRRGSAPQATAPVANEEDASATGAHTEAEVQSRELSYISLAHHAEGKAAEGQVYHIRPTQEGTWSVKREGAQKATKRFDQPRLAVARALELAGENGKVFVHDLQGEVEMVFDAPTTKKRAPSRA